MQRRPRVGAAVTHDPTRCPTCAPIMAMPAYKRGVDRAVADLARSLEPPATDPIRELLERPLVA